MSGTFTSKSGALDGFSQQPRRYSTLPTAQRQMTSGSPPVETFLILREDDTGFIELEDGSGLIELESAP